MLNMILLFIGTTEIIVIAAVVMLLFGGKKLPELMRGLGKGVKEFKEEMHEVKEEITGDNSEDHVAVRIVVKSARPLPDCRESFFSRFFGLNDKTGVFGEDFLQTIERGIVPRDDRDVELVRVFIAKRIDEFRPVGVVENALRRDNRVSLFRGIVG